MFFPRSRALVLAAALTTCAFTASASPATPPVASPAPSSSAAAAAVPSPLAAGFSSPAPEHRPWVFWIWQNGNITREGITADLEALARAGVGGVLIMEIGYGNIPPRGPVDFLGDKWRELFRFAVTEAKRLGLQINMFTSAAFGGAGGFWIRPEHSMQMLTFSETTVRAADPRSAKITLPQPAARMNFYRDIAVLAFPAPPNAAKRKIPHTRLPYGDFSRPTIAKSNPVVQKNTILDLSYSMFPDGSLRWTPPAGDWIILRIGHTTTGNILLPPPLSNTGLECDKLSAEAAAHAFNGQMKRLADENRENTGHGKTLIATQLDSWEVGSQNWTPLMREGFQKHSRYDILPFLPVFFGYQIDSPENTQRFLWDFRNTVSKMVIENYAGTIRRLANKNNIALAIEAYDGAPCDFLEYGGMADQPTGEFWTNKRCLYSDMRGMASAAHIYGKNTVGAEAFTAFPPDRFSTHPGTFKAIGDMAFCEGANQFYIVSYTHQPRPDNLRPGLLFFKWGSHYERTQPWWEKTLPWHRYLTRCQFMLKQGKPVADIAYLEPENSPQKFTDHPRDGNLWDHINFHALQTATVDKHGRIVLPSGMAYHRLVLPNTDTMSVALADCLLRLANAGAEILGNQPPTKVPGLANVAEEERILAKKVALLWGKLIVQRTQQRILYPDFSSDEKLSFTHRRTADGTDIYFVANTENKRVATRATFRATVRGAPELWNPQNGKRITAPAYTSNKDRSTILLLALAPSESVFVIFPPDNKKHFWNKTPSHIIREGTTIYSGWNVMGNNFTTPERPEILHADYGVPGDAARSADVTKIVSQLAWSNPRQVRVSDVLAAVGDVAPNFYKTLTIDFKLRGITKHASVKQLTVAGVETITLDDTAPKTQFSDIEFCYQTDSNDTLQRVLFRTPGKYAFQSSQSSASGELLEKTVLPTNFLPLTGDWTLTFPTKPPLNIKQLVSWTSLPDPDHKYFSGTASYTKAFTVPENFVRKGQRLILNLGMVAEIAEVFINGKKIETLWMPEKRVDITDIVRSGETARLEIRVTNLLQNRLIGDQFLPEVGVERHRNGVIKTWPKWYLNNTPNPSPRATFATWDFYKKTDPLLPSGLLGPVILEAL
ncbi:MAG: hypothetical protein LBT53_09315 [Puniceicoccales bacterium]|nr:hypothetical protein [Puniceicoccales bacterium]